MIPKRRLERTLAVPKIGTSHQHLKRLKNSACTPSRSPENGACTQSKSPENGAWNGTSRAPEYDVWNGASRMPKKGVAGAPEWRLECAWHGTWSAPRTTLQMATRTASLRSLNDTSWMFETAPNDAFSNHRTGAKTAPLTGIASVTSSLVAAPRMKRRLDDIAPVNVARKTQCLPSTRWGWFLFCLDFLLFVLVRPINRI